MILWLKVLDWLSKHAQWDSMVHVTVITITCCSGGCMYINGSICVAYLGSMYLDSWDPIIIDIYATITNNSKTEQQSIHVVQNHCYSAIETKTHCISQTF